MLNIIGNSFLWESYLINPNPLKQKKAKFGYFSGLKGSWFFFGTKRVLAKSEFCKASFVLVLVGLISFLSKLNNRIFVLQFNADFSEW